MHIPTTTTDTLEILSFEDALEGYGLHVGDFDRDNWYYIPDTYGEYRYILGTKGRRPLICAGLNPSTAAPDDLDNTLKSVARIAAGNGFDSWLMFNVYAQRATRPKDMDPVRNEALHRENMAAFSWALAQSAERPVVWAAWGAVVETRAYLIDCLGEMAAIAGAAGAQWVKAGPVSVKGHPHHPLYLKKDAPVEPFDLDSYLEHLQPGRERAQ